MYAAKQRWLSAPIGGLVALLSMLGRNSLYVFCVGALLSLSAQVVRLYARGSIGSDTLVVLCGIVAMGFTAWLAESRSRGRAARSA